MSSMHFLKLAAVLVAALTFGCGEKSEEAGDHDGHDHTEEGGGDEDAPLSKEDQKLADAQKTCPVSGEELGSMGTPIKVSAGGKTVFLCCVGCRKRFEADPEKYLNKMGG